MCPNFFNFIFIRTCEQMIYKYPSHWFSWFITTLLLSLALAQLIRVLTSHHGRVEESLALSVSESKKVFLDFRSCWWKQIERKMPKMEKRLNKEKEILLFVASRPWRPPDPRYPSSFHREENRMKKKIFDPINSRTFSSLIRGVLRRPSRRMERRRRRKLSERTKIENWLIIGSGKSISTLAIVSNRFKLLNYNDQNSTDNLKVSNVQTKLDSRFKCKMVE